MTISQAYLLVPEAFPDRRATRKLRSECMDSPAGRLTLRPLSSVLPGLPLLPITELQQAFPTALLVEPAHHATIPSYTVRQALRLSIAAKQPERVCLIFTDPAHSVFVVSWRSGEARVLLEYRLPGCEQELRRALEEEEEERLTVAGGRKAGKRNRRFSANRGEGGEAVLRLLKKRLLQGRGEQAGEGLVPRIEQLEDVEEIRSAWRALDELRILDLRGGDDDGAWLLDAARALEPIRLALTARTRSFVSDAVAGGKHRPEYLKDLRKRLDRIDSSTREVGQRVAIRRGVVRQNLFAIGAGRAISLLRRRLCEYAELPLDATSYLDCNVSRLIRPPGGISGAAPAAERSRAAAARRKETADDGSNSHGDGRPMTLVELQSSPEALSLRLAWTILRDRRGSELENQTEDRRAGLQLERRRRAILRSPLFAPTSEGARVRPLSPAAFPWAGQGRFHLVRGRGQSGG